MEKRNKTQEKLEALEKHRQEYSKKETGLMPMLIMFPTLVAIASLAITKNPQVFFISTAIAAAISTMIHRSKIGTGFEALKIGLRKVLVEEFMQTYHPDTIYNFHPKGLYAKQFIERSGLLSADKYDEEDVITGTHNGSYFYFSEVDIKTETDDSYSTIFKGILFKIRLPGRSFPKSKLHSKKGLLDKIFGSTYHNEEFDIYMDSDNIQKLEEEIRPLLPFITHLSKNQKDIRISAQADEIIMLMKSDMELLDEPEQKVRESFLKETYKNNIAKQLNTLLFIVDSFINNSDTSEIEERLELKSLVELRKPRH